MTVAIRRPFFNYYGGKFRAARHYPEPRHAIVAEPFAGAAGYSCRYPDRQVALFDLDDRIFGVWSYLIRTPGSEIRRLPVLGSADTVDDYPLTQEAKWLIGFWLNAGASSPCRSPSAWMKSGIKPMCYWSADNRDRIAADAEKIRHWQVFHRSYVDIPNGTATWFVDPPYQNAGRHYRHASTSIDFSALSTWCKERKGQVTVCENEGADWLPFVPFRTIKGTNGKRRTGKSVEVIWKQAPT